MEPSHGRIVLFSHTKICFAILSSNLEPRSVCKHDVRTLQKGDTLPEVVTDDNATTAEGVDGICQAVDRRDIQTVGGFVK